VIENDPIFGVTDTFKQFGFDIADPDLLPDARPGQFPNDNSFAGAFHYREKQASIFGELNYYFSPTVHATVGARYLRANTTLEQRNGNYLAGAGNNSSAETSPGVHAEVRADVGGQSHQHRLHQRGQRLPSRRRQYLCAADHLRS
jgi:outer membrane receptor protein involved in Fe transport